LKSDPLVLTAAIALTHGIADPIPFLDQSGTDWEIQCEVVRQARQMQSDNKSDEIKTLGLSIGNAVAEQIGRMFR
jgi:hypothetical protein